MNQSRNETVPARKIGRGEIYNISEGRGIPTGTEIWPNRPGIVVSNNAINEKSGFVTVVYLTTSEKRDMPYHVKVKSGRKMATALCEQVFSVDKSRIGELVGTVAPEEMDQVDTALQLSLSTIGVNKARCSSIIKKWILAVEKHGIDLTGNPADGDSPASDDERVARLSAERDMYRDMYAQQVAATQRLLASGQA